MAIIFEYSDKIKNKKNPIPKGIRRYARNLYGALEKITPKNDKNDLKGLKALASTTNYNKKGAESKENGKENTAKTITTNDAITRLSRYPKNDIMGQLKQGGEPVRQFLKRCVAKSARQEKVPPVEMPKPTSNAVKPSSVNSKSINMPNGKITYNVTAENKKINESNDGWHIFYDYLVEYDAQYVLDEFFDNPNGKQNWGVLINPEMYAKALRELSRFGKLTNSTFPSKYVYQWMGIIMKNTAILCADTDLAGHSQSFPIDAVVDIAEYRFGIDLEPEYDACSEWLDEQGLYDWMSMPDGSDAWSDFGIDPLMEIIKEYNEDLPPEKVLVLVNRALDVYHQRGDMASIFITNGSEALSKIAKQTQKSMKKIYITEKQLKPIVEAKKNKWTYTHFRKQEDIDNNLKLLLEYPYYYVHFLSKWQLIDDWDEEPYSTLYDLCDNVFASIEDGDEKSIIDNEKKEIYNIIVNDEYLSALSYRYIEDYIKPLIYKQDIIDKYAEGESLKDVDWTQPKNDFELFVDSPKRPHRLKTYLKR